MTKADAKYFMLIACPILLNMLFVVRAKLDNDMLQLMYAFGWLFSAQLLSIAIVIVWRKRE